MLFVVTIKSWLEEESGANQPAGVGTVSSCLQLLGRWCTSLGHAVKSTKTLKKLYKSYCNVVFLMLIMEANAVTYLTSKLNLRICITHYRLCCLYMPEIFKVLCISQILDSLYTKHSCYFTWNSRLTHHDFLFSSDGFIILFLICWDHKLVLSLTC